MERSYALICQRGAVGHGALGRGVISLRACLPPERVEYMVGHFRGARRRDGLEARANGEGQL